MSWVFDASFDLLFCMWTIFSSVCDENHLLNSYSWLGIYFNIFLLFLNLQMFACLYITVYSWRDCYLVMLSRFKIKCVCFWYFLCQFYTWSMIFQFLGIRWFKNSVLVCSVSWFITMFVKLNTCQTNRLYALIVASLILSLMQFYQPLDLLKRMPIMFHLFSVCLVKLWWSLRPILVL